MDISLGSYRSHIVDSNGVVETDRLSRDLFGYSNKIKRADPSNIADSKRIQFICERFKEGTGISMRLSGYFVIITVVLLALLLLTYQSLPATDFLAQPGADTASAESQSQAGSVSLEEEIDAYLEAHRGTGRFMGSVMVARGNEVLFEDGYGMANLEHNVRNTPQTKFRIGSTTKQFTAAAVLQLQEEGKLDVDAPVSTYLPDYPNGDQITVHQLLNHTAGIPNYTDFPDFLETITQPATLDELVTRFKDEPLEFTPGERYKYSNSGYVLLTQIIERVSGQRYMEYVQEHIFEPLDMTDSGYDSHEAVLANRASGYEFTGEDYVHAAFVDMTFAVGAGGLFSTVDDLYKWNRAFEAETILSAPSLETMFAPSIIVDESADPPSYYGYGWEMTEHLGRQLIWHVGRLAGFVTMTARYPDEELLVVVLSNVGGASPDLIAHDIAAIVFGEPYELPKERQVIQIDPAINEAYVGRYQIRPGLILEVTTEKGRLFVQATGQEKFEIYPESKTEFFLKVVDAQITFVIDDNGAVTGLILHQAGRDIPAPKLED
jgi:CubicO group peptidase (beta-lactamase class C family)